MSPSDVRLRLLKLASQLKTIDAAKHHQRTRALYKKWSEKMFERFFPREPRNVYFDRYRPCLRACGSVRKLRNAGLKGYLSVPYFTFICQHGLLFHQEIPKDKSENMSMFCQTFSIHYWKTFRTFQNKQKLSLTYNCRITLIWIIL